MQYAGQTSIFQTGFERSEPLELLEPLKLLKRI